MHMRQPSGSLKEGLLALRCRQLALSGKGGGSVQGLAVVVTGPGRVAVREVVIPEPTPGDVVVRVQHSWISNGTERSVILGERAGGEVPWRTGDPSPFPQVPGYQKVGMATWVGEQVEGVRPGDMVFASTSRVEGMVRPAGGHVSPAVTPGSQVWRLPASVSAVAASGLVLAQVGYNAGTRAPVAAGDNALVVGDGLVGLWTAQVLAARGARVLLAGRHDERLGLAARVIPHVVRIDAGRQELRAAVRAAAPTGVRVLVDTVGSVETVMTLLDLLVRDSHVVSVGFCGSRGAIDVQRLRTREVTLHCPSGWTRPRVAATLEAIQEGSLRTEELVTHRFPVHQAEAAYALVLARRAEAVGVLLDW